MTPDILSPEFSEDPFPVLELETTDKSMANMFWRLIENPEQLEAVRADRSLIRNVFAETLRHTPPVHMPLTFRSAA